MAREVSFLIAILYELTIVRVALKIDRAKLSSECFMYPMEPENRAELLSHLPQHVRDMGPIINVEDLFEVTVV